MIHYNVHFKQGWFFFSFEKIDRLSYLLIRQPKTLKSTLLICGGGEDETIPSVSHRVFACSGLTCGRSLIDLSELR